MSRDTPGGRSCVMGVGGPGILVRSKASAAAKRLQFQAHHKSLFLIGDTVTGTILFMGRAANPGDK